MDPVVDPAANPAVDVDPAAEPAVDPAVDLVVDPAANLAVDPVVDPAVDPSAEPGMVRIRALDLLARREHSRSELRGKLLRRGFAEAAVTTVLDDLAAEGLQSDGRFAEAYVSSRTERGFGPVAIAEDLRRRGLRGAERDAACDPRDPHWSARAREVRRKRFGEAAPQSPRERARQMRFLTRRGFTRDQVRAAFDAGLDLDDAP